MTTSDTDHLAEWAGALLDEILVKAAIDIHQKEQLENEVQVTLTFAVSSTKELGHVAVTSPGSRGRTINVEVPVAQSRTS